MNSPTSTALIALSLIAGAAGAQSTQPVEWKVSEGGNGHWYACLRASSGLSWTDAKQQAEQRGGHLATPLTTEENQFIFQLIPSEAWVGIFGPWLGGYQPAGSSEPNGGWSWVTGETWSWTAWRAGEPNNAGGCGGDESALVYIVGTSSWCDAPNSGVCGGNGPLPYFAVEWSADCNGDGIVDYGQIRSGQLVDLNSNGVPDVCETSITGVQPVSGPAQGGTAINILGNNLPEYPSVSIGGVAALNVVRLSASRIIAVTPPNLPGVADVTVNSWTSQNAFYYRPECGSDLDQNGSVDGGDLAILLLDWGPCYSNAANIQPDDSAPFMLQEQPAPEAPQSR